MKYRTYKAQKAGLTRAINSGEKEAVLKECTRVVRQDWTPESPHTPYWPDNWSRWQRALDDCYPVFEGPRLESLEISDPKLV